MKRHTVTEHDLLMTIVQGFDIQPNDPLIVVNPKFQPKQRKAQPMPPYKELFPSNYIKGDDLKGEPKRLIIESVATESLNGELKGVVSFVDERQKLVLNKTNAETIALTHGENTDGWTGAEITLIPVRVEFQGQKVTAVRVQGPDVEAA